MMILGFDLGDGESAVTLFDSESTVEPRVVELFGKRSILSVVGMREGRIVIGEEASVLAGAQDAQVRFKSRYLTEADAPRAVRMFAQGVMAQIMRQQPAAMAQVKRTVVGCPAGWGEGRREQYAALMESAGFPNVSVVPEPRAAFLYARHARGLRVEPQLMNRSAMVIDMGSSTTDFAYIVDGRQQNQSLFGDTNLGGGLLDELILRHAVKNAPDRRELERVFEISPAWKSYCELEARRLKEKYFLGEEKWKKETLRTQVVVCYDKTLMLELVLNQETIAQMIREPLAALGGRSFAACLKDALRAAKETSRDCPPQAVILTGGASRMAFFQRACREAFESSLVVLCPEPECSIARGLAYAGRVDERLKVFRSEISSLAHGDRLTAVVGERVHELYAPVADVLFHAAMESALESVGLWRKGGIGTIEELGDALQKRMEAAFASEAVEAHMEEAVRDWTQELMHALEGELTSLCLRCGVPPETMSLEGARIDAGVSDVRISLQSAMGMDVLSALLGVVLAAVGASLCGGGGIALVGGGPIGIAAGAAIGVLLALLSRGGMEKAVSKMKVPVPLRRLITDKAVKRGLERQREEVERAIIASLADPKNGFAGRLCASMSRTLGTQLEHMARGAEMSICA